MIKIFHAFSFCTLFLCCSTQLFSAPLPHDAPLSQKEWKQCEKFIKNKSGEYFKKNILSIPNQKNLPYPIEKDPKTGNIYIHLKDKSEGYIGQGCNKIVTKTILYGKNPVVIARCEGSGPAYKEAVILERLKGVKGVASIISSIERPDDKIDIFLTYYTEGSAKKIELSELKVQDSELVVLFKDLVEALINIHSNGFLHRDIKAGNILLQRTGKNLHAFIADFGLAIPIDKPDVERFAIPKTSTPPEVLLQTSSEVDRRKAESYSLATLFYLMLFKKKIPWGHVIEPHLLREYSPEVKQHLYQRIKKLYTQEMRSLLKKSRGMRKKLTQFVFQALNPNPHKRISLEQAYTHLNRNFK